MTLFSTFSSGALAATIALLAAGPAAALSSGLMGDEIGVELGTSGTYSDPAVTVSGAVEIAGGDASTDIGGFLLPGEFLDFDDTSLSFSFGPAYGGIFLFIITGIDATLTGVTIGAFDPAVATDSLTDPHGGFDFRIDDDSFAFRVIFSDGAPTTGRLDLTFAADDDTGTGGPNGVVPLPASALLLLTGLAGLGAARSRRRR